MKERGRGMEQWREDTREEVKMGRKGVSVVMTLHGLLLLTC